MNSPSGPIWFSILFLICAVKIVPIAKVYYFEISTYFLKFEKILKSIENLKNLEVGINGYYILYRKSRRKSIITQSKPILITGASSGIGKLVTEYLAQKDQLVYACARKKKDIEKLNKVENVTSFRLDVTNPLDVQKVVTRVKQEGRGLFGLVNNAGISDCWPILSTSEEMLHRVFNVNVYGPLRITNALIPYLIESQGRIVNVSSISGLFTPTYLGTYSMSKYALEAWSNALSQELKNYNVKVSIIEPGNYKSNIVNASIPVLVERYKKTTNSLFQEEIESIMSPEEEGKNNRENLPSPDEVADAVLDALFNEHPKARYLVISQLESKLFPLVLKAQLVEVFQLFKDNCHRFTVKDLRNLLDEVIKEDITIVDVKSWFYADND